MAVINLTKSQAKKIYIEGTLRAEGVVIKIDSLLEILKKPKMSGENLLRLLDPDIALNLTKGDDFEPKDRITFSKRALEDLIHERKDNGIQI
jgi:hypothetical protein